jgi:hypothetical protein
VTLALREPPGKHTGGRGSGGRPPYIFDGLYNGFQDFLETDDCEVKICLETELGDTLNLKLTFEISCQNPNDGTTESASFSVEYNTSDGFSISSETELSNETGVEGVEFVISPKNFHTESCQLEITGKFCIPDGPEITLDYCGARKTVKPNKLKFHF